MSRKHRVDHLERVLPEDVSTFSCLDHMPSSERYRDPLAAALPFLDRPDPPPELPVPPFGGHCFMSPGSPVCAACLDLAQLFWSRRRALALSTWGLEGYGDDDRV